MVKGERNCSQSGVHVSYYGRLLLRTLSFLFLFLFFSLYSDESLFLLSFVLFLFFLFLSFLAVGSWLVIIS